MFFILKNERYEEEIDRLNKEVDRAHMRLALLKESHLNLEKKVRHLIHELTRNKQDQNQNKEKFCYTITENNIISSYEDPKYLIKHIQHCLDENVPFTLNDMAKNYWLNSLKNNKENKENEENEENTNPTFQWR